MPLRRLPRRPPRERLRRPAARPARGRAGRVPPGHAPGPPHGPAVLAARRAACRDHTHARTHPDPTIATCFDADRLDLARVGTTPHPGRLCTDAARDPALIAAACEEASADALTPLAAEWIKALRIDDRGY
ncbi:MAG: hypothetical protein R3B68_15505 [Phycisphaerales bacterium]